MILMNKSSIHFDENVFTFDAGLPSSYLLKPRASSGPRTQLESCYWESWCLTGGRCFSACSSLRKWGFKFIITSWTMKFYLSWNLTTPTVSMCGPKMVLPLRERGSYARGVDLTQTQNTSCMGTARVNFEENTQILIRQLWRFFANQLLAFV